VELGAVNRLRTSAGFTLIELMVVIFIIVLAAGLMTPTITDFFKGRQLENIRAQFGSAFSSARLRAVSQGVDVSVVFFREGVRVYDERTKRFVDEFNPETAPAAKDSVWFELGFLKRKPNTELHAYRAWEKLQRRSSADTGREPTYNVRSEPRITYVRDGSLRFSNGTDVPSSTYEAKPPEIADIMIFQKQNTIGCYIDLRLPGQFRSKIEPIEKPMKPPEGLSIQTRVVAELDDSAEDEEEYEDDGEEEYEEEDDGDEEE
jgi:prepilin-type N-terminal cleavage/methylation domain-containing protein